MYTKQQASLLRQEFWTVFGKYMSPLLSAEGTKTNWINYKTGIKYISFKMQADSDKASIAIELLHPDTATRESYFKKFQLLNKELQDLLPGNWEWQLYANDEHGKSISRIACELAQVNIFDKTTWPLLISFFKPRIVALDHFWNEYKFIFES